MAAEVSLLSTHPVKHNECQAHGHEYETQCCETRSLKPQREYVKRLESQGQTSLTSMNCCVCLLSQGENSIYLDLWSGVHGLVVSGDDPNVEQSR